MQHVVLARYTAGVFVSAAKQNASSDADHLTMYCCRKPLKVQRRLKLHTDPARIRTCEDI
jgi:hypothetical protein